MENLSLLVIFLAGIISFLSPCILSLVPVYIADLTGSLTPGLNYGYRWRALTKTVFFVAGFSLIFILLGGLAGSIGSVAARYQWLWQKAAGMVLVVLGLHILGVLSIPFLNYQRRLINPRPGISGPLKSFVMGAAFSSGWTPCIGPILSAILALAVSSQTAAQGAFLMSVFSLGLAMPFVALALALGRVAAWIRQAQKFVRMVSIVSGLLVIIIGLVIFFDASLMINQVLNRYLPGLKGGI